MSLPRTARRGGAFVALSLVLPGLAAAAGRRVPREPSGVTVAVTSRTLDAQGSVVGQPCVAPDGRNPDLGGDPATVSPAGRTPQSILQGGIDSFSEGFDDIGTLPGSDWALINNSAPEGSTDWFQGHSSRFPAHQGDLDSYIAADSNNATGADATISNWLLTPEVTIYNGSVLTFRTRTVTDSDRPDRLELRVSLAGGSTDVGDTALSVGDFTILGATCNPDLEVGGYPESWHLVIATISGLSQPTNGRFALRYFVTDAGPDGSNSNYIGIDTMSVEPPPPVIEVSPESLSETLQQGDVETRSVIVANTGTAALHWEISDELFRRNSRLQSDNSWLRSGPAVMGPDGEFAYFGLEYTTGEVSEVNKIDLDPFGGVDDETLVDPGERLLSAVIDPAGDFAYFAMHTSPGRVVKIDLENMERDGDLILGPGDVGLQSAVIDPAGEFAYFGTFTSPGRVVKIDLATFMHVDTLILPDSEEFLMSAVMDPAGRYAYFGASVGGASGVVKIDLEGFEVVDADIFADVIGPPMSAVIDSQGTFAYFGIFGAVGWQVVKVALGALEEVDTIFGADEAQLTSAVMDPLGEYAYFGTGTSPGEVLKIGLDPFERAGAITLAGGENDLLSAVIDPEGTFAYFGTNTRPSRVVKVQLRMPQCVLPAWLSVEPASGTVPGGGEQTVQVTFDSAGVPIGEHTANICFASDDPETPVVEVPVTLTVTGAPVLEFSPESLAFGDVVVVTSSPIATATLYNTGEGVAALLEFSSDNKAFSFDTSDCGSILPAGGSCTVRAFFTPLVPGPATGTLSADDRGLTTAHLEVSGTGVLPPPVVEVAPESLSSTLEPDATETRSLTVRNLGGQPLDWQVASDTAVFDRIAGIGLHSGEADLLSAVVDPEGHYAYFGTNTVPGRVVRIDLETFTWAGTLVLETGEDRLLSAVIDPAGEYAYFGTDTVPGRIIKIDLTHFERVGAVSVSGHGALWTAVMDPGGEYAYFGTNTDPGVVLRLRLADMAVTGVRSLDEGEAFLRSAVIDPAGEYAYFGTDTVPGRVVKVDLATFQRVETVTGVAGENDLVGAMMDPAGEHAYFVTDTSPGRVVKIDLQPFERVGAISLASGENELSAAVIDAAGEYAYVGTQTSPGRVVKIDLEELERTGAVSLRGDENNLWRAVIDPAGEYAYFATRDDPGRVVKVGLQLPDCTVPSWLSVDPDGGTVSGDGEQAVDVTFDAGGQEPGTYDASLCLASNDRVTPLLAVPVTLTVTPPAVPALQFDPASLAFGDIELGMSRTMTATLVSSGETAATGLSFSTLGSGFAADASDCGSSLPVGASCIVVVTFTPTDPGPANGALQVGSSEGASASLALAGRGIRKTNVFSPVALAVDRVPLLSDGNRIFEPGERVEVAPSWRHDGAFAQELSGEARGLTGPGDPTLYEIVAPEADYGLASPAETVTCSGPDRCYQMDVGPGGVVRPATHWDAGFEETLSDDSAQTWALHLGASFADVPPASLFYPFVEALLHHGISTGCGATEFCPLGPISRGQMAVLVLRALEGPDYAPDACDPASPAFTDVAADSPFCPWIEELSGRGIVAGCGAETYCPGARVTRAQVAVFLLRALEGPAYTPTACSGVFADVDCSSLFAAWIEDLYERGITGGCSAEPRAYCPAEPVIRQQMAVFFSKTFELLLYGP